MPLPAVHGLLVLDKPRGITSRDAVNRAQPWFPRGSKLGHTGTLDPLATGVLVLAVGRATRLVEYVQRMDKVYRTDVRLGADSDTDDADGAVTERPGAQAPERDEVARAVQSFVGEIDQIPPAYSAAKVTGRRAYDLARRGEEVSLTARRVRMDRIDILDYQYPNLALEVHCGKGTYIRSLARDLGRLLGCGGYVTTLRRTRVGPFTPERAVRLDAPREVARAALRPMTEALADLPRVVVTESQATRLRRGQPLPVHEVALPGDAAEVALFAGEELVGVAKPERGMLRPEKVLAR